MTKAAEKRGGGGEREGKGEEEKKKGEKEKKKRKKETTLAHSQDFVVPTRTTFLPESFFVPQRNLLGVVALTFAYRNRIAFHRVTIECPLFRAGGPRFDTRVDPDSSRNDDGRTLSRSRGIVSFRERVCISFPSVDASKPNPWSGSISEDRGTLNCAHLARTGAVSGLQWKPWLYATRLFRFRYGSLSKGVEFSRRIDEKG